MRRNAKLGDYTTKLVIQTRSTAAKDALGEEVESWDDGAEVWAKRDWLSAGESSVDGGLKASAKRARFTIHGKPALAMVDCLKIKSSGEVFSIDSILVEDFETIVEGSA